MPLKSGVVGSSSARGMFSAAHGGAGVAAAVAKQWGIHAVLMVSDAALFHAMYVLQQQYSGASWEHWQACHKGSTPLRGEPSKVPCLIPSAGP